MNINLFVIFLIYIIVFLCFSKNYNFDIDIKIYWINMNKSKNRRIHMEKELKKYSLNNERIEGVNGNQLENYKVKIPEKFNDKFKKNKNVVGCALSHLKCIKKAYDNNDEYCIVMEDDICFKTISKWKDPLSKIIKEAPKDWDILHLSMSNKDLIDNLFQMDNKYIKRNIEHYGAIAYLVNKKGINKIYKKYELNNIPNFVDSNLDYQKINVLTSENIIYNHVNTYVYTKILFTFSNTSSTFHVIEDDNNFIGRRKILDYYNIDECEL